MRLTQGFITIMLISTTLLSGCATQAPTEHYWDATSPNWQRTLPNTNRDIKNASKWGLANDDVDELRKREDQLRWAREKERWAQERYQKMDEEARQQLENK